MITTAQSFTTRFFTGWTFSIATLKIRKKIEHISEEQKYKNEITFLLQGCLLQSLMFLHFDSQ